MPGLGSAGASSLYFRGDPSRQRLNIKARRESQFGDPGCPPIVRSAAPVHVGQAQAAPAGGHPGAPVSVREGEAPIGRQPGTEPPDVPLMRDLPYSHPRQGGPSLEKRPNGVEPIQIALITRGPPHFFLDGRFEYVIGFVPIHARSSKPSCGRRDAAGETPASSQAARAIPGLAMTRPFGESSSKGPFRYFQVRTLSHSTAMRPDPSAHPETPPGGGLSLDAGERVEAGSSLEEILE